MTKPKKPHLSIIIPAYNEEDLIKSTLELIIGYLKKESFSWEILVIDDGSSDKTVNTVRKFDKRGVRLISLQKNMGKGAALRTGFLNARGKYHIYTDADLSVDFKFVKNILKFLEKGEKVAIASRRVVGAEIEVHQPWHRETMGRVFTLMTRLFMAVNIADFTCGMKGFSQKASKEIFTKATIDRWAYDAEILFIANKKGFKIEQVPISWKNREDTRVRLIKVVPETLRDLIRIRLNSLQGLYN